MTKNISELEQEKYEHIININNLTIQLQNMIDMQFLYTFDIGDSLPNEFNKTQIEYYNNNINNIKLQIEKATNNLAIIHYKLELNVLSLNVI